MKSQKTLLLAIFLIGFLLSSNLKAQGLFSKKNIVNQYTTVGFGAGSSHYYGDLSPYSTFYTGLYKNVRFNLNANYTKYITPNAALRLQLSWVRILGDDFTYVTENNLDKHWQNYLRNLHFRNDVKEVAISGIFNLLPTYGKRGAQDRLAFTPYLTVGLGLIAHDPKATLPRNIFDASGAVIGTNPAGVWQSLSDLNTSGQGIPGSTIKKYSLVQAVLPIGLGFRFKINNKFDITFEGNLRLSNTDYLDDVGGTDYANIAQILASGGDLAAALSYRATEVLHSRFDNNANRIPLLQAIYSDINKLNGGFIIPGWEANIPNYIGPSGTLIQARGGHNFLKDSYATTQITLSYIISNKIKCPVLK